jgi:serine/threonine protein kinase
MAHGTCPFQSESPEEVYKLVLQADFPVDPQLSPALHHLLRKLLHKNVAERADYQTILDSSFFQAPNPLKSLPLSALQTCPSDSFLTSPDSTTRPTHSDPFDRVQRNVYTKSVSKSLSGLEDVIPDLPDYEYLKKWVNFSDKFGVGGIFSNGIICICFNDKSKIVLSNFGISFHYITNQLPPDVSPPTFNVLQYPKELEKKVKLLDYFIKFLRQNAHLVRVTESMPDNFVHITDFRLTKYAALFVLSNKVRQAIFQDGTEVHVFRDLSKRKRVLFIDQQRHRQLLEAGVEPEEGVKRRLQHVNETLKQIEGSRNQIS